MHLMTFVGPLVENVLDNFLVACVEENFSIKCNDVGDSRSEISRANNTNGNIR